MIPAVVKNFRLLCWLLGAVLAFGGIGGAVSSDRADIVFFYNPETNVDNFATLKTEFDKYLAPYGNFQFQPFNDAKNFKTAVNANKNGIFLLSNWQLNELKKSDIEMEITLLGLKKGSATQRKVLTANETVNNFNDLKNQVVAGSGSDEYVRSTLNDIMDKRGKAVDGSIRILTVPKDIDALMAVGFGMAAAALTAESGLDKLAAVNPRQFGRLHVLGASRGDYFLVAATLRKPNREQIRLLEVLNAMQNNAGGKINLKLLGIDGWRQL